MRILQLGKFYPPDPGGIEHATATLAEGLATRGHEVRVVVAEGVALRRARRRHSQPHPRLRATPVDVVRARTSAILWSQPLAWGYFAAARWHADVVHVHHPHPLADLAALWGGAGGGAGRPVLVITHHSDIRRQRFAAPFYRPVVRAAVRRAGAVVVATQSHLDFSRELTSVRDKCHVIPFGIDTEPFAREEAVREGAEWRARWGDPDHVIVGVGRLVWYKGFDVLLRATAKLKAHVVLVGHGPERQSLDDLAVALGIRSRVHFTGYVDEATLPGLYQASDIVALPSIDPAEMFGITLLEGMASGKPVLSTLLPTGVREVNIAGETGVAVEPGDTEALRAALGGLLDDPTEARRLGERGRRRVRECFSLDQMLTRHEAVYQSLVSRAD